MRNLDFSHVEWGPDEAKGDKNLPNYFFEFEEYPLIKEGDYRYVIGRKGTGKTAVLEKLKSDCELDPLSFFSSLSLRNFPLTLIRDLRDKSFQDKSQFVPVWTFLILVEIAKLVVKDHGAEPELEVEELKYFLLENFGSGDFTIIDTIQTLKTNKAKMKVKTGVLDSGYDQEETQSVSKEIHYQKLVTFLESRLKSINSNSKFLITFDELDEGYSAKDKNLRLLLLSLLRAIEDTYLSLVESGVNFRPVVALRSDIFDSLEDNDLNKLDDYLIRLNWSTSETSTFSLYKLVNKRINASFSDELVTWSRLVHDNDTQLPNGVDSVWKYVVNRTFERPRDIIKFLKLCGKECKVGPLTFENVRTAEVKYSTWFYNEFRDEIQSHLPVWRESVQTLSKVGRGAFKKETYAELLLKNRAIQTYLESEHRHVDDIIETLFNFSLIGNQTKDRRWLFKYKDHDLEWDEDMKLLIHFGVTKKLRL
ncbi:MULTISPECIES: P-loop ATPase, Sll1717 family [Vibrio harveyi group]|uniref:P-loop ATPase, Sll1717 family n=1 Tax=Vibrio harveyi group TaxID=717610 RepID=UPI000417FCDF|nr:MULTISPECIES: hypothetical protein [Vibrio harveyi group]MBS9994901.1 hypothetical protein [Vibrio alginolyticus]HCG6075848.1 hypothetical protein [Vibrio parahaemolyticus]HCG6091538.1 hypothetical protein [Vibrio parahaemolyticus]HCH1012284.1 hypothetical protein [Vibrio parahaemolyticus]